LDIDDVALEKTMYHWSMPPSNSARLAMPKCRYSAELYILYSTLLYFRNMPTGLNDFNSEFLYGISFDKNLS